MGLDGNPLFWIEIHCFRDDFQWKKWEMKWMENDGNTMKQLVIWRLIGSLGCKRSLDIVGCWRNPLFPVMTNHPQHIGCLRMVADAWSTIHCLEWMFVVGAQYPEMVWFAAVWGGMSFNLRQFNWWEIRCRPHVFQWTVYPLMGWFAAVWVE